MSLIKCPINSCGCTIYYKAAMKINQLAFINAINKATAHLNFHKDSQCFSVDHNKIFLTTI